MAGGYAARGLEGGGKSASRAGAGAASSGSIAGNGARNPQTLAQGADGASRFGSPGTGIVIVHGSQDFHAFIAGAVTEAANRGYTVQSTQSMRGSPVGH
jgi:hypothetical protein